MTVQVRALEESREKLRFWEEHLKSMVWNSENEDGSMFRLVDQPHEEVLRLLNQGEKKVSQSRGFPASKRELLDKLQVEMVVMADRIEVKALFPIEPINCQLCTSVRIKVRVKGDVSSIGSDFHTPWHAR